MKFPAIFSAIVLGAMAYGLFGCASTVPSASTDPNVLAIQKSCNDPNEEKTMINGHAYMCDDYDHFQATLQDFARKILNGAM